MSVARQTYSLIAASLDETWELRMASLAETRQAESSPLWSRQDRPGTLGRLTRCASQLNPLPWESSWSTRKWKQTPPTLPPLSVSIGWTLWTIFEFVEGHFLVSLHFTRTRIIFSSLQTTHIDLFCLVSLCVVLQSPLQPSALSHSYHPIIALSHQSLSITSASSQWRGYPFGPAGSHLLLYVRSPWLRLQPPSDLLHLDPSPWLMHLHFLLPRFQRGPSVIRPRGLSLYIGSTWVRHRHTSIVDLRVICCSLALHPFGSDKLRPPSGSASALSPSSSTSAIRILVTTSRGSSLQLHYGRLGLQ